MGRRARISLATAVVALSGLLVVSSAHAAFHLMKIREVHEGGAGTDYVELQMYASGQNFVSGHFLVTYGSSGAPFNTFPIPSSVPNGENQRTILIADGPVPGATPDFTAPSNLFPSPMGSVCFVDTLPSNGIDCVSIGNVTPPAGNPSPAGNPVLAPLGISAGQSIHRSITPNCPTLLEAADDTNNSATDFALGPPSPRPNSVAPTETACGSGDGGGGPGPNLELSGKKKQKAGGKIVVKAICTDQDCALVGKGKSKLKGSAKSSATAAKTASVKLKQDSADATLGETVKLKLKHSKGGKKKVKRSVRGGGKAKAVVKVTATGAGGSTTEKFTAKLKK